MGCYFWYSEEGTGRGRSPPRSLLAVPNVTAHPSTASVPITVLLHNDPLLCSFNVLVKGLKVVVKGNKGKCIVCRYYLRNNTTLEPLVPDELVPGILREMTSPGSVLLMRNVSSLDVAVQLTRRDFELFRSIEPSEYISDLFELEAAGRDGRRQSSRNLDKFSEVTIITRSARLAVGPSLSLAQRSGTHCQTSSATHRYRLTVSVASLKHSCL